MNGCNFRLRFGVMCHVSVETKIIDNISAGQDSARYGCFFYGHVMVMQAFRKKTHLKHVHYSFQQWKYMENSVISSEPIIIMSIHHISNYPFNYVIKIKC